MTNDHAWLDHINGKAHHRQLGYSMRLKPETEDQVTTLDVTAELGTRLIRRTASHV